MERQCLGCNLKFTSQSKRTTCDRCMKLFGQRGQNQRGILITNCDVVESYFEHGMLVHVLPPAHAQGSHTPNQVPLRTTQHINIPY